jgi:hypothetical protein
MFKQTFSTDCELFISVEITPQNALRALRKFSANMCLNQTMLIKFVGGGGGHKQHETISARKGAHYLRPRLVVLRLITMKVQIAA